MGGLLSRHNEGVQNIENTASDLYRYPPAQGKYFADYFILGGTKFDAPRPEAYLFGENNDLNLFSQKPVAFPYPSPSDHQPTKTLRSLLNLRKDTLKLFKCRDTQEDTYHIEFTFDADIKCLITIYYKATQDLSTGLARFSSKDPQMTSVTFNYPKGSGQVFSNATRHRMNPGTFEDDELNFNPVTSKFVPVIIHIEADDEDHVGHSNITLATFERATDGSFAIKPYKQKQMVDGVCYLLQEIYGIENKQATQPDKDAEESYVDMDETGLECVICINEPRDTLILPCRHLCLCRGCAESLRYQASNCPICRSPFVALLQISAFIKKTSKTTVVAEANSAEDCELPGYQEIPLVEALNGKIKPENIPEESAARLRRRSSAASLRSSGRKALSRASSSRSYRHLENSAGSALSRQRPGSAMKARVEARVARDEVKPEKEDTCESVASPHDVDEIGPFELVEDTTPPLSTFLKEDDIGQDEVLQPHMDVSLPGTPLSREDSGRSSRRNASTGSATSAITPTCVSLEDSEPPMVSV